MDQDTPEDEIAAFVDAAKRSPDGREALAALLPERHPLYAGRSTNATIRIRGYVLAAFERTGLPETALPYVLEELESGRDAYVVAAAAKALRGHDAPPSVAPSLLLKAIENVMYVDDALTFAHYKPQWPLPRRTTALEEICATFAWLGPRARTALPNLEALATDRGALSAPARVALAGAIAAIGDDIAPDPDCCAPPAATACSCCAAPAGLDSVAGGERPDGQDPATTTATLASIAFEDQDGRSIAYGDFFSGKPAIVAFFYTRCDNPNKCSLTVTKLGRLQLAIREAGLRGRLKTAAITYDPDYDLPQRLKAYGESRGVGFGADDRFLRTRTGFATLRDSFGLGVNFGQALVNRHRIELFILDDTGHIAVTFARRQWDVHDVLQHAKALLNPGGAEPRHDALHLNQVGPADVSHAAVDAVR